MLMIDLYCTHCEFILPDILKRSGMREPPYTCPKCHHKTLVKTMLQAPGVIGDECDVTIKNGLCNADGSPRRYTSKADIKRVAKHRNLVNWVEHKGTASGDKSKVTQRFI